MKEKELIKEIIPFLKQGKDIAVGPGDDCAAIDCGLDKLLLIAADQTVAGIHYDPFCTSPGRIARKLLKRNVSDIAAMGGTPSYAVLTMASGAKDRKFYLDFFRELGEEAEKWNVSVCGGDISSNNKGNAVFTLTIAGWVEKNKICLRSNAADGDLLYATGTFGNSYKSEHHLDFTPRVEEAGFLAGRFTNTMIDVSDGILSDCMQLADASGLGIVLSLLDIPLRDGAAMPSALSDGEDYELLFAVSPERAKDLEGLWPFKDVKLSRIGSFTAANAGKIFDTDGNNLGVESKAGYDHFNE